MSDVKVQQRQALSRQEAARLIAALADGLGDDGRVTVRLGSGTLELSVGSQVDFELEVAVDGDEIELELELKWSAPSRRSVEAAQDQSEAADLEEDDSGQDEFDEGESDEGRAEEDEAYADGADQASSDADVAAEQAAQDGASDEEAAGPSEGGSPPAAAPDQSARPRGGRRKPVAATGQAAFNGVDTAAVRAWAAANGLTVSPRGRIKEEVIEAYRAAGN